MALTNDKIYSNQMKYLELLSKIGVDLEPLSKYLDNVDYFNMPLTIKFANAYKGGLCKYALDVYYELCQLVNAYAPGKYTEEDVIKVALFKDLYKAEMFEQAGNEFKYKETRPTFGDLGFNSYMIAKYFVQFTDEQIEAITQSGAKDSYAGDIHEIYRSYPLVVLTKMADMAAMYLGE